MTAGPDALVVVAPPRESADAEAAGSSRWLVFGTVATALFMASVDLTIVATAMPAMHRGLHAPINWVGWTITIYGLGSVIALPIAGWLSGRLGRRQVFLGGVVLFSAASLACGFAGDVYVLIVFRALQAFGGGAFAPSASGLVAEHFGESRERAIGMFGTIYMFGQIVGPILGGVLVGYLSWRWIFFVNVPVGIVLIGLVLRFVPRSTPLPRTRVDLRGIALTSAFVLAAILGATNLGNAHIALYDPTFLVPELCALALLVALVRHTNRAEAPFIPLWLLRGKGFAAMNWLSFLQGVATFGTASLVPLFAEQRYHLAALSAGTLLTARAVGAMVVGTAAALAIRRTGYRLPLAFGFTVIATGWILMSMAPRFGLSPTLWLTVCIGVTGLGLGAVNPAAANALLHIAPDQVSAITGLRTTFINLGVIFSVAITTAILNRSAAPGVTQTHLYWVIAGIVLLVMVPLAYRIPERKGGW